MYLRAPNDLDITRIVSAAKQSLPRMFAVLAQIYGLPPNVKLPLIIKDKLLLERVGGRNKTGVFVYEYYQPTVPKELQFADPTTEFGYKGDKIVFPSYTVKLTTALHEAYHWLVKNLGVKLPLNVEQQEANEFADLVASVAKHQGFCLEQYIQLY